MNGIGHMANSEVAEGSTVDWEVFQSLRLTRRKLTLKKIEKDSYQWPLSHLHHPTVNLELLADEQVDKGHQRSLMRGCDQYQTEDYDNPTQTI